MQTLLLALLSILAAAVVIKLGLTLLSKGGSKRCPQCQESIPSYSQVCPRCMADLTASVAPNALVVTTDGDRLASDYDRLLKELIRIGRQVEDQGYSASGYLRKRGSAEADRHPRARSIGEELHRIGGLDLMMKANREVSEALGPTAALELSHVWHRIGEWLA